MNGKKLNEKNINVVPLFFSAALVHFVDFSMDKMKMRLDEMRWSERKHAMHIGNNSKIIQIENKVSKNFNALKILYLFPLEFCFSTSFCNAVLYICLFVCLYGIHLNGCHKNSPRYVATVLKCHSVSFRHCSFLFWN